MNDIERQIEGVEEENVVMEDETSKEEDNIKHKINHNSDDDKKKRIIMYVIIGVLATFLVFLLVYILLDNDEPESNDVNSGNQNEVVNGDIEEPNDVVVDNIGYVSCDDNTALLNVRNSISGNIIDGLSCYKEVTIEEELDGNDACDRWYKISYIKNDNSYTGYSCGTYIKKLEIKPSVMDNTKKLIDKANDYYDNSVLKAYCGTSGGTKTIEFEDNMTGEYVKSEYKNIDELKKYLLSFLDKDLINIKLELSDIDNPKYYDNYYEIDGSLYCRNYAGKGWNTSYTNNYDIEITSVTDDKINVNIAYEYIDQNSDCKLDNLAKCSKSDFVYEIGKLTIQNGIITKMDFHK